MNNSQHINRRSYTVVRKSRNLCDSRLIPGCRLRDPVANIVPKVARKRVRRGNLEDAEHARQELINAAQVLFDEGGMDNVTIRSVAKRVNVSPMAVYSYFPSKAALLAHTRDAVLNAVLEDQRQRLSTNQTAKEQVFTSVQEYLRYWLRNPEHYRLIYLPLEWTGIEEVQRPLLDGATRIATFHAELIGRPAQEINGNPANARLAMNILHVYIAGVLNLYFVKRQLVGDLTESLVTYSQEIVDAVAAILMKDYPEPVLASMSKHVPA